MYFQDRVVVVTGAAGGIGSELAVQLGRMGAKLGLVDRNPAGLDAQRESLKSSGIRCASAVADVRNRAETHSAVHTLAGELGPVDVMVAGAGLCAFTVVDDLNVPLVEEIVEVNFLGAVYAIEAVLPSMLQREQGQIVGIASLAAVRALPFEGAYCASKAALAAYLESLRPPLRRRGVKVTTVFPGFVRTPLLNNLLASCNAPSPPGVVSAENAAGKIIVAIRRGSRVCSFPRTTSWLSHASRLLPPRLYDRIMTRMAKRVPLPY